MKLNKHQNTIFVAGVSLLIILVIYVFTGGSGGNIFAYPGTNLSTTNATAGYPGPTSGIESVSGYPAPNQMNSTNQKDDECIPPIDPASDTLKAIDPCAPPTPMPLPTPTPSPTPNPGDSGMLNMTSSLTIQENAPPEYQLISPGQEQILGLTITTKSLTYNGPLPSAPPAMPNRQSANSDLADNWDLLVTEGFEDVFPQAECIVSDHNSDGYERYWGADDGRPLTGFKAGWPAKGGADGVEPTGDAYPDNMDSWLVCGPYDLSEADKFIVDYSFWHRILDFDDFFFSGVSTDGSYFEGFSTFGTTPGWIVQREHIQGVAGDDSVWVAWVFRSDDDGVFSEGVWMDDLRIWRYNTPANVCGNLDSGNKGVVLSPYENIEEDEVPMIRAGDTLAVDALKAADVNWVRLELIQKNGAVNWQEYDRMVDTLCANGISTLGLLNHDTLVRQDFEDPDSAEAYRQEFATQAKFITEYYEDRITYWEVWNEPNLFPGSGDPPYIAPERYAPLLEETYQAIKNGSPQAQVLFGGLASAWNDANQYFVDVYNEFGGSAPFDYFAIHPYSNGRVENGGYGVDPQVYLHADIGFDTILDKFTETMYDNLDGNKKMWVTEIGWNSSLYSPNKPWCRIDLTTEEEQDSFLKPAFDILLTEVHRWNTTADAVEKVIWYQYMDIGIDLEDVCPSTNYVPAGGTGHISANAMAKAPNGPQVDWWFGLYRGDKTTPKQVWCEYFSYPLTCEQMFANQIYLPVITKP